MKMFLVSIFLIGLIGALVFSGNVNTTFLQIGNELEQDGINVVFNKRYQSELDAAQISSIWMRFDAESGEDATIDGSLHSDIIEHGSAFEVRATLKGSMNFVGSFDSCDKTEIEINRKDDGFHVEIESHGDCETNVLAARTILGMETLIESPHVKECISDNICYYLSNNNT